MSNEDTEIRRRAEELVKKIEQRIESAKVLQATKIHLVYKDTPLPEAVADFRKKSGFNITLHDPEGKLKDRKITLDTGETTFWTAFDKFCAAANLVEAKQEDLIQQPNRVSRDSPAVRALRQSAAVNRFPQVRRCRAGATRATETSSRSRLRAVEAVRSPRKSRKRPPSNQRPSRRCSRSRRFRFSCKRLPPIIVRPDPQPAVQLQPGQIVLKDGKPKDAPTDYSTSIRVRAMEKNENVAAPEVGQSWFGLQVSPEPKIIWQNLISVTITKAVDDKDQTLAQAAVEDSQRSCHRLRRSGPRHRVVIQIGPGWDTVFPVSTRRFPSI